VKTFNSKDNLEVKMFFSYRTSLYRISCIAVYCHQSEGIACYWPY